MISPFHALPLRFKRGSEATLTPQGFIVRLSPTLQTLECYSQFLELALL
jgi:hypothetical protein